jgi:hypothetical protein
MAKPLMTRDEWKEWIAESWAEAQARASIPEQKPVAYVTGFHNGHCVIQPTDPAVVLPVGMALYREPREWVGLTPKEVDSWKLPDCPTVFEFCQFIEAKLKEKNI